MVIPLLFICTTFWPLKTLAADNSQSQLADFQNDTDVSVISTTMIPEQVTPKPTFGVNNVNLHCPSVENAVSTCPKG
uniref:Uncharacterized protein n=1 Tax=Caenorhabditis japonica TaxID=281687 RepID=A0A8R1IER7_CAEJA